MTLTDYFHGAPKGMKAEMATSLGITRTWMSLIISGRALPSAALSVKIEKLTHGKVNRQDLRIDLFGE